VVSAALETWPSLPTKTQISGSVWVSFVIAASEAGQVSRFSEAILASIISSVLKMSLLQSIGRVIVKF
jgi:hypothetical protein